MSDGDIGEATRGVDSELPVIFHYLVLRKSAALEAGGQPLLDDLASTDPPSSENDDLMVWCAMAPGFDSVLELLDEAGLSPADVVIGIEDGLTSIGDWPVLERSIQLPAWLDGARRDGRLYVRARKP